MREEREEGEKGRRGEGEKGEGGRGKGEGGRGKEGRGKGERGKREGILKTYIHGNNVETVILLPGEPCGCLLLITLDGDVHKLFSLHFSQILWSAHSLPVTGFLLSAWCVSHVRMSASRLFSSTEYGVQHIMVKR